MPPPDPSPSDLSAAERELVLILAEEQARYEARDGWDFNQTLWARVTYRMARARGRLVPTHIPNKFDMERGFEATFRRLVARLGKRGLVRYRAIGDGRPRPRQTLGYRSHEARARDLFLTDAGKALAAKLRAEAAPPTPPSPPIPPPDGDVGGTPRAAAPATPSPDGDVGWPDEPAAGATGREAAAGAEDAEGAQAAGDDAALASEITASTGPTRRPRRPERPRAARTPRRSARPRPARARVRR